MTNGASPLLTVIIPAYNEAAQVAESIGRICDKLNSMSIGFEVIVVDDASSDATGEIVDALAAECSTVRVLHHTVNRGIGASFLSGVRIARGEFVILIPADLAVDLDELRRYLALTRTADIVVGVCGPNRTDYSVFRRVLSRANVFLIRTLYRMPQRQFNYINMYRASLLRRMNVEYAKSAFFFAEILIKATSLDARIVEVDVRYVPRQSGTATGSNLRFIALTGRDMLSFWTRHCFKRGRRSIPD